MRKKLIYYLWSSLAVVLILIALSCDTTKPKPPVFHYELNLVHDADTRDVYADINLDPVQITVELKDEDGNFLSNQTVIFTWENMDAVITYGAITPPTVVTDNNGKGVVFFHDNGQAGNINVSAKYTDTYDNSAEQSITFQVLPLAEKANTLTLRSSALINDNYVLIDDEAPENEYMTEFYAHVLDDNTTPVENLTVQFSNLSPIGALLVTEALTDNTGKATATLSTLGTEFGEATVTAYVSVDELARAVENASTELHFSILEEDRLQRAAGDLSDTLSVTFMSELQYIIQTQVASLSMDAVPEVVLVDEAKPDSVYTVVLNAVVTDENGVAVSDVIVHFENLTPGLGTIGDTNILTDDTGVATTTLTANIDHIGSIQIQASIQSPADPDINLYTAVETISLISQAQHVASLAAQLNTWTVNGILPGGNSNIAEVDTIYARVTDANGGSLQGVVVNFQRMSGNGYSDLGVLSDTDVVTDENGIARTIFTALVQEIPVDGIQISIMISVPQSDLAPHYANFVLNTSGNVFQEYNVSRFEWYKGFVVNNDAVQELFVGNVDSITVSSDYDYLLFVASAVDSNGARINRLPVQFVINNDDNFPNGDLSTGLDYTCCTQDSLGVNIFSTPADMTLFQFVIDQGHPDEANGLVPVLYYNQQVNVCDNLEAQIVDPTNDQMILHTADIKVCISEPQVENPVDMVANLSFNTSPENVLLAEDAPDSTYKVVLNAIVRDSNGVPVEDVPVHFINDTPELGILLSGMGISNNYGYARDTLYVSQDDAGDILLKAVIYNVDDSILLQENKTLSVYSIAPPVLVESLQAWPQEPIIHILNPSQVYTDTLYARALTADGAIVPNAPVNFQLNNPDAGSISAGQVFTNADGIASVVFFTSIGIPTGIVELTVTVPGADNVTPAGIQITIAGQVPYEENVNTLTLEANPPEIIYMPDTADSTYSVSFNATAKDIYGVAVQNVPVYFMNLTSSIGTLTQSLAYTDTVGVATSDLNLSDYVTGSAVIKSYILSSQDETDTLFSSYKTVDIMTKEQSDILSITTLISWASSPEINVTRLDSTYCDTLFAVAQNMDGGGVDGIGINFSMDLPGVGYLSESSVQSDSTGTANTVFCAIPGTIDTTITFTVSIPGSAVPPNQFSVRLNDELPQCPDCLAELVVWADDYVLPGPDDHETTTVYATYTDSLGYGPENNTIIVFQSLIDSAGVLVPFASIGQYGHFENDTARVNFNMTNDAGLATIIGTYEGLSDTIFIELNSTALEYLEFIPTYPSEIMVEGGGGVEATEVSIILNDGNGNPVTDDYLVSFEITTPSPTGVHFNGDPALTTVVTESSNGIASVTVNAGTTPGTVRIKAVAFELDDIALTTPLAEAIDLPVTIHTGPPAYGIITAAYNDLTTIGGGNYQLPISVTLWDLNSNPVDDSTTVWLSLYEFALPWDDATPYENGDLVMWGNEIPTDSLVYVCITELDEITGIPPTGSPFSSDHWQTSIHPAIVSGEAKTGGPNMNGDSYQGIAWGEIYYTSMTIFDNVIIKAQTYDGNGGYLLVDSRDNNNGLPHILPILPGQLNLVSDLVFWDFSNFPNAQNPSDMPGGGCFTDIITLTATLSDFYMESIDNGRLLLNTIGGQLLDEPPSFDPEWNPSLLQITDPNGQARWYIRYNIELCPVTDPQTCSGDCLACEYDDFSSAVWVNLLNPQQMTSNQVEISLMRSGGECDNCP